MGPFTFSEIEARLDRLRERLAASSLDAILVTSGPAFYYYSGAPVFPFGRPMALLVPAAGDPVIVCSVIERDHVSAQSPITDRHFYWDFNLTESYDEPMPPHASLTTLIALAAESRRVERGRIGFEDWSLPARMVSRIHEGLPDALLVPVDDLVERLRMVKSATEIDLIRRGDAIADAGEEALLAGMRLGAEASSLHRLAYDAMLLAAVELSPEAPFHVRVGTGLSRPERSAGHSEWITWDPALRVEPGRVLVSSQTATIWGYGGNVERTVATGKPRPEVRRAFDLMIEANERAIEAIRPGVAVRDVDAICKDVFARHGYSTRSGSGLGRGFVSFEADYRELVMDLRPYSDVMLEPGMAFSLEPDLQTSDGVFRHCNTIIVTTDGCIVDSTVERGMIVVDD